MSMYYPTGIYHYITLEPKSQVLWDFIENYIKKDPAFFLTEKRKFLRK